MSKVAIVTDSSANLLVEQAEEQDIHIVPLRVIFGQQSLRDGVDITTRQFYEMLTRAPELPTTSQPSTGDFVEVYGRLSKEAEGVVSIHLADSLSGVLKSALLAREMVTEVPIEVIDSGTTSLGLGLIVLAAAQAARQGKDLHEVVEVVHELIPKTNVLFVVDTLKYLHMGGRIGGAAALLGTALNIKPIVEVGNGQVTPVGRVRSKCVAKERMLEIMGQRLGSAQSILHAAVAHAASPDEAEELRAELFSRFQPAEFYLTELTPALGTHGGPGALGLGWYVA